VPFLLDPTFIPSTLVQSATPAPSLVASTLPHPGLLPSQLSKVTYSPILSPQPDFTSSTLEPPGSISLPSLPTTNLGLIPTDPAPTDVTSVTVTSQGNATGTPPMQSTDQGLRPIPPAATQIGDPNGHHEITEPNFSATRPCRGCSPVIEISATGWLDTPAGEQHGSTLGPAPVEATTEAEPPRATIPAGSSNIVIDQDPSGENFVIGGSTTLTPGQTVTVDDTPIVVQTSEGRTEVVVGTTVIPLTVGPYQSQITDAPISLAPSALPPLLTIGDQAITPNAQSQYVVSGQTLAPGGAPLTISGTTLSLAPSATALIVDGKTSTLTPILGAIYTTVAPAALTFNNHVYTTNRAGYIVMGPGTTLVPGGSPVTVDGTTLSLVHSGTAVVVQGTTKTLQPVTTVVTLTRGPGAVGTGSGVDGQGWGGITGHSTGDGYMHPTGRPITAGAVRSYQVSKDWIGGLIVLIWWAIGSLAILL
jgi:hypothetical protein